MHLWRRFGKDLPPVILVVACNGGVQGKEYNENIPETPDEIADSVYEAHKAGAPMVHIHPRDKNRIFNIAQTPEDFYEVNRKVRE